MASCPDSDNSWVLAGSEVGRVGLGSTWERGFLHGWAALTGTCRSKGPEQQGVGRGSESARD